MPWPAASAGDDVTRADAARTTVLEGLLAASAAPAPAPEEDARAWTPDPVVPRVVIAVGIAVISAALAALLAAVASGSLGPGRLTIVGPEPGPVALAVGAEVLLGAAILLLSPRARRAHARQQPFDGDQMVVDSGQTVVDVDRAVEPAASEAHTEPIDLPRLDRS